MCGAAPVVHRYPADAAEPPESSSAGVLRLRVERGVHATVRQHDRGIVQAQRAPGGTHGGPSPARASGVIARASLKMWRRRWAGVSTNLSCTMERAPLLWWNAVQQRGQRLPGGAPRSWRAPRRRGLARLPECRFAAWFYAAVPYSAVPPQRQNSTCSRALWKF